MNMSCESLQIWRNQTATGWTLAKQ